MPSLTVNGARLHYEESGSGPETLVFAHGLLWCGRMYEAQVAHFKDRYRCLTFDFRGQGKSEVTRSGYDMETLTADTIELLGALHAARCHFVGLSMGGFIGLRLAIRRPELLSSLTLIDTAADPEPRKNLPKYAGMALLARVAGMGLLARPLMKIMFGRHFMSHDGHAAKRRVMRERLMENHLVGASRATLGILTRASVEKDLPRIGVPTLVIHGESDFAIAERRMRSMASKIRGARVVMVPRAGHTSTVEEPELVIAAMEEFLGRLPRAPGPSVEGRAG